VPRIAMCVPHGDRADPKFFRNLLDVQYTTIAARSDLEFAYIELDYRVVSLARHIIVEKSLEYGADLLFWVDDDMLPPEDALLKLMSHDKDFVSALYVTREYPHTPQMYQRLEGGANLQIFSYPKALIEVGAVGHGCCLVRSDVYKRLAQQPVQYALGVPLSPWYEFFTKRGEDFYFCDRLHEISVPVLIDTTIVCKHMTDSYVDERHFLELKTQGVICD